jgi:hypothetical protein
VPDPRRPEAQIGNPRLAEIDVSELNEVTGLVKRGAHIEAQVRIRRDGVHAGLIQWIRNYAAQHQDMSSEDVLRAAMRLFIGRTGA